MPKLGNTTTKRLDMPSSTADDPAWCEVKEQLQLGDITAVNEATTDTERAIVLLSGLITAWNYTDADGNAVEPTRENIEKLDLPDFIFLSEYVGKNINTVAGGLTDTEKKTSSSDLTAVTVNTPPII